MEERTRNQANPPAKKEYTSPTVTDQGRVEDLTQWVGGLWGEFLSGQGSGWNPWQNPGSS